MSNATQSSDELQSAEGVYFISEFRPAPGTAEEHGWREAFGLVRHIDDVKADWSHVFLQVVNLVSATQETAPVGYHLDEVKVSLGFDAKGKLAFIAEAGVNASVEVTFKRFNSRSV